MKKTFTFALLMACSAAFAGDSDSYLYWMVDNAASGKDIASGSYTTKISYQSGNTWTWAQQGNYLDLADSEGTKIDDSVPVTATIGDGADNMSYFSDVSKVGNAYYFFVELWNDEKLVGVSDALAYSLAGIGSLEGMGTPATLNSFASFSTAPIPEPTSGMMLLLGVAALALRRRRRV